MLIKTSNKNVFYVLGSIAAFNKLGMAAGSSPVAYAERNSKKNPQFDYTADQRQDLWAEMDQEDITTGEESSLGMPSAVRTAGLQDGGYADHSSTYAQGGFDANKDSPERNAYLSSAIEEAFKSNEDMDPNDSKMDPPTTNPHGSKYANNAFAGSSSLGVDSMKMENPFDPNQAKKKMPKNVTPGETHPLNRLHQNMEDTAAQESFDSTEQRLKGNPL